MDRLYANLPIDGLTCGRSDVLQGRSGTLEQKSRIIAAAFAPGVVSSSVVRRHCVHPNQLYARRREVREALGRGWDPPAFTSVVMAASAAPE